MAFAAFPHAMPRGMLFALVRATRPLAHANIAPPILFGQALAVAATGSFSWRGLVIAHAFGLVDHLFIVLANDFADRHDDARNRTFNAFSGGSRVLPEGALAPSWVLALAVGSALALLAGSIAIAPERPLFPWLAAIAIALVLAYSYPPLRLSYRGGGEWVQAIGVGVVLPITGFYAQHADLGALRWTALVPTFVLGLAGNVLTSLPDEPADREARKRTWAVRRGLSSAKRELVLLVAAGIAIGAIAIPFSSHLARLIATALPLGALGTAIPHIASASPNARGAMLRFMAAIGAASTGAILAWTIALWLSG